MRRLIENMFSPSRATALCHNLSKAYGIKLRPRPHISAATDTEFTFHFNRRIRMAAKIAKNAACQLNLFFKMPLARSDNNPVSIWWNKQFARCSRYKTNWGKAIQT